MKVVELHAALADWARAISWGLKRLTLASNGVVTALTGASTAARPSMEANRLISMDVDELLRVCIRVRAKRWDLGLRLAIV